MKETDFTSFKKYLQSINWVVLIFLVLVLNVKLPVKILALLFISLINRKQLLNTKILSQGIIVFYFSMIFLVIVYLLLHISSVTFPYAVAATMSAGLWFMSALAVYQIFIFTNTVDLEKLHNTLTVFFILNVIVVGVSFLMIILETRAINPFEYKGLNQKFYVSTGDYVRGITFDYPVTTAVICSFGIIYFLYREKFLLSMSNMAAFLLLGSNMLNMVLLSILIFIFCFRSDATKKSIIIVLVVIGTIFLVKISPGNFEYSERGIYKLMHKEYSPPKAPDSIASLKNKPDSLLNFEDKRKKYALLYIDSLSTVEAQQKNKERKSIAIKIIQDPRKTDPKFYEYKDPPFIEQNINHYKAFINSDYKPSEIEAIHRNVTDWNKPGKLIAFAELADFYKHNPGKIWLGNGPGNFSSRVAFKTTGLNIAGGYPQKLKYINPDFKDNHLYVYLFYRSKPTVEHSALNTPDSVYGQLLSEYGIIGFLCFLTFYVTFFLKRIRYLTYGLPMLLLFAAVFFFEYWFELLSIVILFEFLLLVNIKESSSASERK